MNVEQLDYPLAEISSLLNKIDDLCLDVTKIETFLSEKYGLSRKMIRQVAIEYHGSIHSSDFTATLNELQLLQREKEVQDNPASIIFHP